MRVLHVISGLGVGGAETFLSRLAPRLAAQGFEQVVVSLKGAGPLSRPLEAAGVKVVPLDLGTALDGFTEIGRLKSLMQDFRPDVTQGWMYHGDLAATIAHRLAGRPGRLAWGIRCSNMDFDGYSLQLRLVVRLCAAVSGQPDLIIANSHTGAKVHREMGYGPGRMEVVPNGMDVEAFRPDPVQREAVRLELGIGPAEVVAFSVARVDPMKDHATLVAAAERIAGLRLVLVGSGTERLTLPASVMALGRREDVARLLCAGDVVVSSSAFGEGFPNAVAEGMACGLVPVATDVGDTGELVGATGHVVPPRDVAALAGALEAVLHMPAGERADLGRAARDRIGAEFSLDRAVARFAALYRG